jgi:hypothetical protein
MTSFLAGLVACIAVPTAMLFTPWLMVRLLLPRASRDLALATTGLTAFILNLLLPCLMHLTGTPIEQSSLALLHFVLLLLIALSLRLLRRSIIPPAYTPAALQPWLVFLLMLILVLPFTHMAGIDTYKWQDLATNMAVEKNVPWLVHPLALAGFAPRSYPSLHPLMQGSLGILGATGVDGAFWLTSLVIAFTGVFAANLLASVFTPDSSRQAGFAAIYVLAPVFMRYVHWGTGRGVYLAILPLFVWGLLKVRRPSGALMAIVSGLCLILAHKAGCPTLMVLLPAMTIGLFLPTRWSWTAPVLLTLTLVVGVLMSPRWMLPGVPGYLLGYLSRDIRRLGWVGAAAVIGMLRYPRAWNDSRSTRACLGGLLATLPLAHHREMYGAMLTLPFVCIAAWRPVLQLVSDWPRHRSAILKTIAVITLAGGAAIVVQRSAQATPARVYRAAMFIEKINPRGPFRVLSSERHGIHIQGYVSGCPRFTLRAADPRAFSVGPPPLDADGPLHQRASAWIAYLRGFLSPPGLATDWYGGARTIYHVILDDEKRPPAGSVLIYDRESVKIFDQTAP